MKSWSKTIFAALLCCIAALTGYAQQQPINSVEIISIGSASGRNVARIFVTNGGNGYDTVPAVTVAAPPAAPGAVTATATATISGGAVTLITITNPGAGYTAGSTPAVTIAAPTGAGPIQALAVSQTGFAPPNEGAAPFNVPITVYARGTGTFLTASFTYTFFVNGVSIGTTGGPIAPPTPAGASWTPPQPGAYFLTVVATDGVTPATSLPVRFFATGTTVNSPVNNTIVPQGSSVVLKADSTVGQGFVRQIQFRDAINGAATPTDIGTADTTIPYSLIFTPSGAAGTTHDITAVATDNNNAVVPGGSNTVRMTIVNAITPLPTSLISSPSNNSVLPIPTEPTTNLTIAVDAHSPTGVVSKVEIYIDGVLFTTKTNFPYTAQWHPTVVGTYRIVALTYDDKNNVVASPQAQILIAAPPTVAITSPTSGGTVTGGTPIQINATATDSNTDAAGNPLTITGVQFFVDGVFIGQATSPISGNTYQITATLQQKLDSDGNPKPSVITALATDSGGLNGISPGVSVTVTSGGSSGGTVIGAPPTGSITAPTASTQLPVNRPVFLAASANDTDGNIISVQFFVNNTSVGTATAYPYTGTWTPVALGNYAITARITDSDGNAVTSAAVSVSVVDPSPNLPSVTITDPLDGTAIMVGATQQIRADASDAVAVKSVQFFVNGEAQGAAVTTFPFVMAWTPAVPGNYTLTARAVNAGGNQATSPPVAVTVSGGNPPSVAITAPTSGGTVPVNTPQTISATAVSTTGSVVSVQFFVNGTALTTDVSFPYSAAWTPASPGTYSLRARATDNVGNFTDSNVTVTVAAGNAPTVAMTNPITGGIYSVGTSINLTATATDSDGTVATVQFFVNGLPQGQPDTSAPYSTSWTPAASGTYVITAQATDNTGNVRASLGNVVSITNNGAPSVSVTSPAAGAAVSAGTVINLTASATDNDGSIATVRFFVNGNVVGSPATTAPFLTAWTPSATGNYTIIAEATDNSGNVTNSALRTVTVISNQAPTITLSSPPAGSSTSANLPVSLTALASDADGTVVSVRFLVNGIVVGTPVTAQPYATTWTPTAVGSYTVLAEATDNSGNITTSATRTVNVIANQPPIVNVTAPTSGLVTTSGLSVGLAATASDNDGTVTRVRFLVNGNVVGTPQATGPFNATWTPTAAGTYTIIAEATDNVGNIANSAPVTATVVSNRLPTIAVTAPANATIVRTGVPTTLTAAASDADGNVASVQFFINGIAQGSAITVFPYRLQWTPTAEGIFRITASATDNAGGSSTSAAVTVMAVSSSASTDTVDTGIIVGIGENGRYAAIDLGDKSTVFIGSSTANGVTKTYYFASLPLGINGEFTGSSLGHTITGTFSETGSFGTLDGNVSFSGIITSAGANSTITAGLYSGNIAGRSSSLVNAIVGSDGSIAVYLSDGSFQAVGFGAVDSGGNFSVLTNNSGARFTGKIDPKTGFLTGTLTGGPGGSVMAATATGASFSDGSLRNLSTRGQVGTGNNVLIAGFAVGGTTPKQVLVRAIGPTLAAAPYNLPGTIADPQLQVYDSQGNPVLGLSNNNWAGNPAIAAASGAVGAFGLTSNLDAALLTTLQPGGYSVQVSGVNGGTGLALVELWDVDNLAPFSAQKVMNISTRGQVGTGNNILIAGFVVSGQTAKKVLIRGIGPSLGVVASSLAGSVLADPVLRLQRLVDGAWVSVRENDSWEVGNDGTLVADSASKVGAFALQAGSKDAAILLNLPPGIYSAEVSGAANTTGIALVEVWEIP